MPTPSPLQRFIDDELDRAPLMMREVLAATLDEVRRGEAPTMRERRQQYELQRPLAQQTTALVERFVQKLREHIDAPAAQGQSPLAVNRLALVDEEEIAADVEVSRAIDAIKSVAENELRELRGYTAALAGEPDAARDTNPFRAEVYARCLWQATATLPVSRGLQLAFMHHFAMPLALTLRTSYAATCRRLDDQGIEPAAYRTVILPPGSRRGRSHADRLDLSSDINRVRETMPAPFLDVDLAIPVASPELQQRALVQRLFEAMLADPALPAALHPLISALQAPVLRVALQEPGMVDDESHAAWRFLDRLAFAAEVPLVDGAGIGRLLRVAQGLVDHIARAPEDDETPFRWAEDRLAALQLHALQQRRDEAAPAIESLHQIDAPIDPDSAAANGTHAIDADSLDTVPATLLDLASIDAAAKSARAAKWLEARRVGDVLRIFMHNHWTGAQVLWRSENSGVWLLTALPSGPHSALRRGALERLFSEGLAEVMSPRSLVHDAAERVLQGLDSHTAGLAAA